MTSKPKTYFEQVPLEVVKKIAKVDGKHEISERPSPNGTAKEKTAEVRVTRSPASVKFIDSSFDIFQVQADGSVIWQGLAASIEEAKERVKELQLHTPAQYMVASPKTGSKLIIDSDTPSRQLVQNVPPEMSQEG